MEKTRKPTDLSGFPAEFRFANIPRKRSETIPLRFNEAGDINRQNGKSESSPSANIPFKKFLLFVSQWFLIKFWFYNLFLGMIRRRISCFAIIRDKIQTSVLFREIIRNVILHVFYFFETGKIPTKRPSFSSCNVFCERDFFDEKLKLETWARILIIGDESQTAVWDKFAKYLHIHCTMDILYVLICHAHGMCWFDRCPAFPLALTKGY